ncbi:MAG TPA: DUF1330 domain-containing protein [Candidatus Aquilonibacter sp.]|nr:DUF1330 domain-containing protein [Candidatus Aquilonibacter sp.]
MAKGYFVSVYRSISDPAAFAEYAKLARPALEAAGGKFLTRGAAVAAYENGLKERVVIIEFESAQKAMDAHESSAYQAALKALGKAADRDVRVVEGMD